MLTNYHTHTTHSDGKNTPEEVILFAIENGIDKIGISDHSYTEFDLRYCMKDVKGYIADINRLKEKYKGKIEIYLGIEADIFSNIKRSDYDYIISSSHYFCVDGSFYPIDSNFDYFKKCLEVFGYDIIKLSKTYYETFCSYIKRIKPDIIGHFDVITKFDEIDSRFLCNEQYLKIADHFVSEILKEDVIFEVNTGAIAREIKSIPYPHERLLHIIKKQGGKVMLASDSHNVNTLTSHFDEALKMLGDIGFEYVYTISDGRFKKDYI